MGDTACQIIIVEGNLTYAVIENYANVHPENTAFLESAVKASCDGTHHASLYMEIEEKEIAESLTTPIINLHKEIINKLAHQCSQEEINTLAIKLYRATRKLYLLYNETMPEGLVNLEQLINNY